MKPVLTAKLLKERWGEDIFLIIRTPCASQTVTHHTLHQSAFSRAPDKEKTASQLSTSWG